MQKVIEIERGKEVPDNAVWIESKTITIIDRVENYPHPMGTDIVKHTHDVIYDVFIVGDSFDNKTTQLKEIIREAIDHVELVSKVTHIEDSVSRSEEWLEKAKAKVGEK